MFGVIVAKNVNFAHFLISNSNESFLLITSKMSNELDLALFFIKRLIQRHVYFKCIPAVV